VDIVKTPRQATLASIAMKISGIKCKTKTANGANKLPGTEYSTSKSLALGYTSQ